jgi:hypothetical protein
MSLQETLSYAQIKGAFSLGQVTYLQEITQKICKAALCQMQAGMTPAQQALGVKYLLQNQEFFQRFKYYLAKGVAETLGINDRQVQAIYLFEPVSQPEAETGQYQPLEATIHLLVVVSKASAALDAFIEAIEQSLTRYVNKLPSPLLAESRSILDVILVTEEAVEQRQGYASLISSILAPPFKLWERPLNAENNL